MITASKPAPAKSCADRAGAPNEPGREGEREGPRPVHHLELDSVRVVKEHRVVAGCVVALAGSALDLGTLLPKPGRRLIDCPARWRREREVMHSQPVAV